MVGCFVGHDDCDGGGGGGGVEQRDSWRPRSILCVSFVADFATIIGRGLDRNGLRGRDQRPLLLLLQEAESNFKPLPIEAKREALALHAARRDVVVG